ncbi:oxidoreductase [Catellatospora sp. TT07R-123]|uniref:aldo/keto reductase n=1 Tax=Catellatospora sp. TT07R-123 TaxID=2733863 RepID=UPI001B202F2B|nr:aldo/keto reductase [Catellatospora sp. TT07R-123]GHJ48362.1 oxidoreductase [Catellatospora sp. TT07R-123]
MYARTARIGRNMALQRMPADRPALGLGLAAVGRPGYINLGRGADLPPYRSVGALAARTHELLDAAYAAGVRYVDTARSYGRAEEFLATWLRERGGSDVVVGSKWGYTYTARWRVDADVHETKDHSLATYARQLGETRAVLDGRLDLYQIHSMTPDSPALADTALHRALAELRDSGVTVGFSTSGPHQAATVDAALAVEAGGAPLFGSVQATWNLLEPSAGPALARARDRGCRIIVKEGMANGRLAGTAAPGPVTELARELGTTPDAVALAAALAQPWADIVLSGAATVDQLRSNLAAAALPLAAAHLDSLDALAEPADAYWRHRAGLPWS